jgi:hypothetical protein
MFPLPRLLPVRIQSSALKSITPIALYLTRSEQNQNWLSFEFATVLLYRERE